MKVRGSSLDEPVLKIELICFAQGHKAVTLVRLKPVAPLSPAKHSTTEPRRFLYYQRDKLRSIFDLIISIYWKHMNEH